MTANDFSRNIPQPGVVTRYRHALGLPLEVRPIGLAEGNTPLIYLEQFCAALQLDLTLYAKYEGLNPTGSFKDRGMAVATTHAHHQGAKTLLCASTGNTSASAAAYAARAGMGCVVLIPEGKIAFGKLAQAMLFGAKIIQIKGNFDAGMELVKEIAKERTEIALVNSVNPWRIEGQKTAAFEVVEALSDVPDYHVLPVGNAGNITAYWKGYTELHKNKTISRLPKMVGYQASGAAPFISGKPIDSPDTIATAIRIGNPQSWQGALAAVDQSSGWFGVRSDRELLTAMHDIARYDGIFCEPASAISVAGVVEAYRRGAIVPGSTVVCTLTGNGLKDAKIVEQFALDKNVAVLPPDKDAILALL